MRFPEPRRLLRTAEDVLYSYLRAAIGLGFSIGLLAASAVGWLVWSDDVSRAAVCIAGVSVLLISAAYIWRSVRVLVRSLDSVHCVHGTVERVMPGVVFEGRYGLEFTSRNAARPSVRAIAFEIGGQPFCLADIGVDDFLPVGTVVNAVVNHDIGCILQINNKKYGIGLWATGQKLRHLKSNLGSEIGIA